ncbi:amidase [Zavarzinia sp.]|uniref:amidase n=1 Tax=Zavarzinia sp. TaxID=2027920 RepID=UPI00356A52FD
MSPDEITSLSALELARAIHTRRLRCRAVMEAFLARIDAANPAINALVSLAPTADLLDAADTADQELADGHSRGWLHGMPTAIKDLAHAKGLPTSFGSPLYAGTKTVADSIHVARLRAAGAIFVAKTNTPEMGLGSHTYNPVFGITRNPLDLTKSAGGSSGGAAAALAAHMLPIADGSDMMGSLRNPAAFNAVVGFRPSFGRVPDESPECFLGQLAVIGPMARNVADAHALLATMAGYDARDPLSLDDADLSLPENAFPKRRIGWLGDFGGYLPVEPAVTQLCEAALGAFEDLDLAVESVEPGFAMDQLWRAWVRLRQFQIAGTLAADFENEARRARLKPELQWEIEGGLGLSGRDIHAASATRSAWYRHLLHLFARYDFLVLPAAQLLPFDAEIDWPHEVAGRTMDSYHRWMEVVIGPSMAGLPVAAMPAGFAANGLPAGLQIIGPPRADAATLAAALAYEKARA